MAWYYMHEGAVTGPVERAQLRDLFTAGTIREDTLVRRDVNMDAWLPYVEAMVGTLEEETEAAPPIADGRPVAHCSQCRRAVPLDDTIEFNGQRICADCKEPFFQRVREGVDITGELNYAGFWIRAGAFIIDWIITNIASFFVGLAIGFLAALTDNLALTFLPSLIGIAMAIAYQTFFLGRFGATLGKMALGLKVVRPDGSAIGYGRAFGRYFGYILSGMILGIGFIIAAFDSEKRALHDNVCGTRVIRTR